MTSLQARLAAGLIATLVVLLGGYWVAINVAMRHVTEEFVVARMEHEAETLLASLAVEQGKLLLPESHLAGVYHQPFSGHYYRVWNEDSVVRSRSLWDVDLELSPAQAGELATRRLTGPLDQSLLVTIRGYRKGGEAISIAVAEDLSHLESEIARFQWFFAAVSLGALLFMIAVQALTVRRGLQPLDRVRRQLGSLERGELQQLDEDAPDEIRPLVTEVNRLVEAVRKRLDRSRNALGNLAHSLKTPLTVLGQMAGDMDPALKQRFETQTGNIRALVERELKRARLAGDVAPGRRFKPAEELPPLVDMLRAIYRDKGLSIQVDYPGEASYAVDREDMMEIFGNLLDNACKWARSTVVLYMRPDRDLEFLIEDDGPGVAEDQVEHLVKRGVRIDESTAGSGLGLAIVRDVVDHYGGQFNLGRSERLGGFRVRICIPVPREL